MYLEFATTRLAATRREARFPALLLGALLACAALQPCRAQAEPMSVLPQNLPAEYRDVGVTEHRGAQISRDLQFMNERGEMVRLADMFSGKRPLILQIGYFDCPMLCDVVSRGVIDSVAKVNLKAGTDYDFLFVSINPTETPDMAAVKKEHYILEYSKQSESGGFHFLVSGGDERNIHALADAVGFRYSWVPSVRQFAHASVIMVLTPDGHVSRYLYGVQFPQQTLRLSLVEASNGKIGEPMDQILLFCLHYDAITGKYAIAAMRLMQVACALTALTVGGTLLWFFRRESAQRRVIPPAANGVQT
jgi:protein SCO1/2